MAKAQTVTLPTREDVRSFLYAVDHDAILAARAPKIDQGIVIPGDLEARKRVYDWLQSVAHGDWP